ncbi:hypothetical protein, partial [Aeromonas veronii]|uniref:hypothetical protein n=1 Tax=Aeromonas veronii TaxID=654 RepID=UPI00300765D0
MDHMVCSLHIDTKPHRHGGKNNYIETGHNLETVNQTLATIQAIATWEGANKRGNSPRLTQSFHFFMFEPI